MEQNNSNKSLDDFSGSIFSDKIHYEEYKEYLERYVEINKPDFIALLCLKRNNKVLYFKNYSLKFDNGEEPSINKIIRAVNLDQFEKIAEIDKRCMEFVKENKLVLQHVTFKICFTANLIENKPGTYIRNISIIPRKYLNKNHKILVVDVTDFTNLIGAQKRLGIDIKCSCKNECEQCIMLAELTKELKKTLAPTLNLTRREREVLGLIAEGLTSEEIAKKLFISITTVQTHRQNLIKKYNVKNTVALVRLL